MGLGRAAPSLALTADVCDRAPRSIHSGASPVRRPSSQASRAWAADLVPGDKRLVSEPQFPQPAQQLKSHSLQARGPTAAALPLPATRFFDPSTSTPTCTQSFFSASIAGQLRQLASRMARDRSPALSTAGPLPTLGRPLVRAWSSEPPHRVRQRYLIAAKLYPWRERIC